jgi:FKBP-type peptidyl-prolyl cis-trans isomerase FklB
MEPPRRAAACGSAGSVFCSSGDPLSVRELSCALALAAVAVVGCRTASQEPPPLRTPEERFSYGLGARLGSDVRKSSHAVDRDLVLRGVQDGLDGTSALSDDEVNAALKEGLESELARRDAAREEAAQAAERDGRAFLARNRERPGVVTLPSGLQYEVLRAGSGPSPGVEDVVTCHYTGSLLDGTVFDDTAKLGAPRTFRVSSVIDGFEEALLQMPTGARWKLYVPAALAYGERGAGAKIPPNATLIFEVELVSIGDRLPE